MSVSDSEGDAVAAPGRPGRGLAVASLSVGAAGLVLALSTWAAWLLIRPQMQESPFFSWLTGVFVLVLGALWFAVLPAGVLGIIFGLVAGPRSPGGAALARAGAVLSLLALATAVPGAVAFVFGFTDSHVPGGAGSYPGFFPPS
ncbi:hypothetical protein [Qaidamihabitans albus]|uniref:hypothetical protein n=1 Tax=Qaidamihabitans albus TaxID=2795733 RepID=UPI0018F20199|nr:hypothetical protein [Qaidamihabitans albus]